MSQIVYKSVKIGFVQTEAIKSDKSADLTTFYLNTLKPFEYNTHRHTISVGYDGAPGDLGVIDTWVMNLDKGDKTPTIISFAFGVDSWKLVDEVFLAALQAGGKNCKPPGLVEGTDGTGKGYSASVIDPAGNIFEIKAE